MNQEELLTHFQLKGGDTVKLKAVIVNADLFDDAKELAKFFGSREFDALFEKRVRAPHLKSPDLGPAEAYIQKCDFSVHHGGELGIEVRLTGISGPTTATRRSIDDYPNALHALVALYRENIERRLSRGLRCQLFVSMMTDTPVPFQGKMTTLLEADSDWIDGKKDTVPAESTAAWTEAKRE